MTPTDSHHAASAPQKAVRRPLVAVALAALAVGGVGVAVTTAAWTDNTFFTSTMQAATFGLQGSMDGQNWTESDDAAAVQLTVPASAFADMVPGESREIALHVRNIGSVDAVLTSSVQITGSTFTTDPSVTISGLVPTISANGTDEFILTVTAPADWADSNQGASASIVVTISGESVAG